MGAGKSNVFAAECDYSATIAGAVLLYGPHAL
jgi:hypothetical protein